MNINYKEAQFEFFPNSVSTPDDTKRPHFMAARFNLSIENLVIFSIMSIMVVIFTFSLGVERGKGLAFQASASSVVEEKAAAAPVSSVSEPVREVSSQVVASVKPSEPVKKISTVSVQPQDNGKKPSTGYTVQVASYKTEKSALREAQTLQKKGFKAFVLPKGEHVVLCVGNFQKKEEASVFGKKLKSNYQDFVVRRL